VAGTTGRRGSVRRDRSGSYSFCVDVTDSGSEVPRQLRGRGFGSAKEARQALTAVLVELDAGTYVAPDRTTTLSMHVEDTSLHQLSRRVGLYWRQRFHDREVRQLDGVSASSVNKSSYAGCGARNCRSLPVPSP
jgi:hypothetical protein